MTIVRAPRPEANFTMIRNSVLRDGRIGLRARGLLALILSYPDDWRTDYRTLARTGKDGETAIRTAFKELRDAGYVQQRRYRDEAGRWRTDTFVYDTPQRPTSEPAVEIHAGSSTPESDRLYEDGHEDCDEDDVMRTHAARGRPHEPEEDTEDWRALDYQRFADRLAVTHLTQKGKRYPLRTCYDAIRKQSKRTWPGLYFETMDDIDMWDWLERRWGFEEPA